MYKFSEVVSHLVCLFYFERWLFGDNTALELYLPYSKCVLNRYEPARLLRFPSGCSFNLV